MLIKSTVTVKKKEDELAPAVDFIVSKVDPASLSPKKKITQFCGLIVHMSHLDRCNGFKEIIFVDKHTRFS